MLRMACVSSAGDVQLDAGRTVKYIGGRTSSLLMRSTGCRTSRTWPAIAKCEPIRRVHTGFAQGHATSVVAEEHKDNDKDVDDDDEMWI